MRTMFDAHGTPIGRLVALTAALVLLIGSWPQAAHARAPDTVPVPAAQNTGSDGPAGEVGVLNAPGAAKVTLIDLGRTAPKAVNNRRQVVGESTAPGDTSAVLWQNGQLHNLGKLGGQEATFTDINENNQITGVMRPNQGADVSFRWTDANTNQQIEPGELQWLGNFGGWTHAEAINNSGHVAGTAHDGNYTRAFRWTGAAMQNLGTLGGPAAIAHDINDAGTVVGTSYPGDEFC